MHNIKPGVLISANDGWLESIKITVGNTAFSGSDFVDLNAKTALVIFMVFDLK